MRPHQTQGSPMSILSSIESSPMDGFKEEVRYPVLKVWSVNNAKNMDVHAITNITLIF